MKKLLIASDIHGSAYYLRKLFERIDEEKPERIFLLGDLLYHGPRNDLPKDYDPRACIDLLNSIREDVFCIRGNCDTEVDQMVLSFPIMADFAVLTLGDRLLYASHGHHCGESNPPALRKGDILLCGHTHVPACTDHGEFIYMNPGSVAIPKGGSCPSYMVWEEGTFCWKHVETGEVYRTWPEA